jgi:hypothetical protein
MRAAKQSNRCFAVGYGRKAQPNARKIKRGEILRAIAGNEEKRAAPAEVPEPQWKVRKLQAIDLADHPDAGRLDHPAEHPDQAYLSGSAVRPVGYRTCWPPWFCWFMRSFDMLSAFRFPLSAFRFPLSAFRFPLSAFRFPFEDYYEQNNGYGVSAFLKPL